MQKSKIARFPRTIREELNERLDRSEQHRCILKWINGIPEIQTVLKNEFGGEPVKRQNLTSWKKTGFRNWLLRQAALDFTQDGLNDDLDASTLERMSAKLIRHLQLRYAAVAGSLPDPQEDPEAELRRLAGLCANLTALRRGDLSAERLAVEQQRLALEKSRTEQEMEKQFWAWTERPEIQAKLYPHRDDSKVRRDVDRLISESMLGIRRPEDETAAIDPCCLI
jgi:hypothetical protein